MNPQNYSAVDAYRRWADYDLAGQLRVISRRYLRHRLRGFPARADYRLVPRVSAFAKWRTVIFGRVTWAVFTRAFWAIYQPGLSPVFYGSVVVSDDVADESTPSLFEIAEYSRRVKEYDVPIDGIEEFARVIRDDNSLPDTMEIPVGIAMKRGVFLQTVGIERARLPCGYLHHRLLPVVYLRRSGFVSIVHHRYWGAEFSARWCAGDALLSEEELREYRVDFPEIEP
jgi:hypothetical protein